MLYRYQIVDNWEQEVDPSEQLGIFEAVTQRPTAYWKREPEESDYTTFLVKPRKKTHGGEETIVYEIGYNIGARESWQNDPSINDVVKVILNSTEFRHTRVLLLPRLGIAAARHGSNDTLEARPAMGRTAAVLEQHSEFFFEIIRTAESEDILRALRQLHVSEFSFEVRPFNPHPSKLGEKLHKLLQKADIGRMRGTATPKEGASISMEEGGMGGEALGMTEKGYGSIGAKLRTSSGTEIDYPKQSFRGEKEKDLEKQSEPRDLKIHVPSDGDAFNEEDYVVETIKELFK